MRIADFLVVGCRRRKGWSMAESKGAKGQCIADTMQLTVEMVQVLQFKICVGGNVRKILVKS